MSAINLYQQLVSTIRDLKVSRAFALFRQAVVLVLSEPDRQHARQDW
jgi:hypothetical protein